MLNVTDPPRPDSSRRVAADERSECDRLGEFKSGRADFLAIPEPCVSRRRTSWAGRVASAGDGFFRPTRVGAVCRTTNPTWTLLAADSSDRAEHVENILDEVEADARDRKYPVGSEDLAAEYADQPIDMPNETESMGDVFRRLDDEYETPEEVREALHGELTGGGGRAQRVQRRAGPDGDRRRRGRRHRLALLRRGKSSNAPPSSK